ncbi:hypothetical protein [Halobacteriovorax sp. JY17]|uniref:hypothetical protein n=1 Tax=Halobacteriovorax sp. JY17 TaxID=2014617 RepID=UPI000C6936CD|nr:hypothetical protein [Halobacteriovorax sp. JY17]PIK15623.1 MAG: hypothetical protein CES88_02545 [Halobacteriovorax sp. JY17]
MKSTYFRKPLEFSIEVNGESWKQGDSISGKVSVSDHSGENSDLSEFGIFLCIGDLKKIQKKDNRGITILDECLLHKSEVEFNFSLDENCQITQKSSGPYLIVGKKEDLLEGHHLALQVGPSELVSNILEVLENFMRFKVKSLKPKKDSLEAVITLPTIKEFTSISSFKLNLKKNVDDLLLDYDFKIKKVCFEGGVTSTKDEAKSFQTILSPKEYLIYGSSLNQDAIVKKVSDVLDEVKLRPIL